MPPNRRAISCPDLFGLDDHESLHAFLPAGSSWTKPHESRHDNNNDHCKVTDVDYWDWNADHEFIDMQAMDDASLSDDCQETTEVDANPSVEDSSSGGNYWNWVQWRHKDIAGSNDARAAASIYYWSSDAFVSEKQAAEETYKANSTRRVRLDAPQAAIVPHDAADYWYGM